jgi:hypothetical protein
MNKRGQRAGARRGDRRRFPYKPRLIGGKLYMPAGLQSIHQAVSGASVLGRVADERRAVVETLWPDLVHKLPPT